MNKTEKLLVVLIVLVGLLVVLEVGERVPRLSGAIPVESSGGLSREEAYRAAYKKCIEQSGPFFCYNVLRK